MKIKHNVVVMTTTEAKVIAAWEASDKAQPAADAAAAAGVTPAQAAKIRYQFLTLKAQIGK